jgi:hypothetical protein
VVVSGDLRTSPPPKPEGILFTMNGYTALYDVSGYLFDWTVAFDSLGSPTPNDYTLQTFTRSDPDAKAFLTHLGRALLVDATLQVVDNYNLRCQSFTNIGWQTLFAGCLRHRLLAARS